MRTHAKIVKSMKPKGNGALLKYLVNKFVLKEKIFWPRDMTVAKRLSIQFPEKEFWESFSFANQFFSMVHFQSVALDELKDKYRIFKLDLPAQPVYNLAKEKVGEDVFVSLKPKSLMDFLK